MENTQKKLLNKLIVVVVVAIVFGASYLVFRHGYSLVNPDLLRARWTNERVVAQMGMFGYLLYDIDANITTQFKLVSNDDFLEVQENLKNFKRNSNQFIRQSTKKNVLLVQLESMDGILMNHTYNNQEILPNLNSFAKRSIYFPNTFDITGTGRTSDGEFAALTSLLPIQHEVVYEKYDVSGVYALPKILNDNGYTTISMHGYKREFWNRMITHKALGFDQSYFIKDLDESEIVGWGISDKSMAKQAVDMLEKQENPTFLHLILLTNHYPYNYAPQTIVPYTSTVEDDYLNSAHYQDEAVGILIDELEKRNMLKDTVICIYGDHDSAITRKIYPYLNEQFDDQTYRNDNVPLILYTGLEAGVVDETYRGQIDVAPLILDNLGIEVPKTMIGNGNFYNEKGILLQNGKLIYNNNGVPDLLISKVIPSVISKVVIGKTNEILEK